VVLLAALVVGLTFLLGRTAFGRHVYAVGGNARRPGGPGSTSSGSS
jgi:ABC-type xylose transport system permease subunit